LLPIEILRDKVINLVRKLTKEVKVGTLSIGGVSPISIQSMTNTDTRDIDATVKQILLLKKSGCDIVRMSVYDEDCAKAIPEIKRQTKMPLVADIHFDYRLAVLSIENGIDKLRINPGNIGSEEKVKYLVDCAKERNIPIRIGVNAGSLKKEYMKKYGGITAEGMVESALEHVRILEKNHFYDIVISLKASNVLQTVESYRLISQKVDYPLHLGVTEAGTVKSGIVKSAIGIGALLLDGIGDTLRVSLTGDPVHEVKAGIDILKSLGLRNRGIDIVSCPTCGRCQIDLEHIVNEVERIVGETEVPLKVAIMGCVVNGPGEAKEADIGIAGGKKSGVIFRNGSVLRTVPEDKIIDELVKEITKIVEEKRRKKNI